MQQNDRRPEMIITLNILIYVIIPCATAIIAWDTLKETKE